MNFPPNGQQPPITKLLAALCPLGPQIVEVQSSTTGEKLPAAFKPAKPLKKKKSKM